MAELTSTWLCAGPVFTLHRSGTKTRRTHQYSVTNTPQWRQNTNANYFYPHLIHLMQLHDIELIVLKHVYPNTQRASCILFPNISDATLHTWMIKISFYRNFKYFVKIVKTDFFNFSTGSQLVKPMHE